MSTTRIVHRTQDVTFREGLRLEQMTAKLATLTGTDVDPEAFYKLVTEPTDALLGDYPWLLDEKVRPKGASLEGFLYPATYTLRTDPKDSTTAEDLVRMMLDAFYAAVGPERLNVAEKRGLTFYEVLTLASIVEREAVLDEERPQIAGVYQNRIDRVPSVKHGLLQADPTNIYAVDTVNLGKYDADWVKYKFWTVPKGVKLSDVELPESLAGLQHLQGSRSAARPDRNAHPGVAGGGPGPGHEERLHVLRRDSRGQGSPRLLEVARRAREEAPEVRLLGCRSRRASPSRPTSRRRPMQRPAPGGATPSERSCPDASSASASAWRPRGSKPTSA